jgi:hypothetical protein
MKDDFIIQYVVKAKPLGQIKTGDILRVARRIMRRRGFVTLAEVWNTCRPRIPGTQAQYQASLEKLLSVTSR